MSVFFGDNYVMNVAWWILSDYRNSSQRSHVGSFTAQQLFIRYHGNRFWNFQLTSKWEQLAASENVVCCHSTLWFWNIIHRKSQHDINSDVMQLCCDCVWEWEENKENTDISGDSRNGEHNEQHHGRHKLNQNLIKFLTDILPLFLATEQGNSIFLWPIFPWNWRSRESTIQPVTLCVYVYQPEDNGVELTWRSLKRKNIKWKKEFLSPLIIIMSMLVCLCAHSNKNYATRHMLRIYWRRINITSTRENEIRRDLNSHHKKTFDIDMDSDVCTI